MFRVWKTHAAKRSAVSAILPFVRASRLARSIPDSVWLDAYFVGFLGMLITLTASRAVRSLDNDEMGAVQNGAWCAITGMKDGLVGDEICALSADRDPQFEMGCRHAHAFFAALQYRDARLALAAGAQEEPDPQTSLWARYFDAFVDDHFSNRTI